ncbi:MAG: AMMECR1 domain-containing protein, partial [Planctomycetes bacterium]|nr:AMMECR1 domain-containing protein [Planctomycetota bacterium]
MKSLSLDEGMVDSWVTGRVLSGPAARTILAPMRAHKPVRLILMAALWPAVPLPADEADPPVPAIATLDQRFLTRVVRRTLEQQLRDESIYEVNYTPPGLRPVDGQVVVTLRQRGIARGVGTGRRGPVVTACRDAAIAALVDAARRGPVTLAWLSRIRVDVEVAGSEVPIAFDGRWSDPTALNRHIEPGVHGLVLQFGQARRQFCPSEIVTKNVTVHDAVRRIAQQLVHSPEELAGATILRFRTRHWHETSDGGADGQIIELPRGLVPIEPADVTRAALTEAIDRLVAYMIYRQLPSGLFSYQYEPSVDAYSDDDNLVRQAGVVWSLARYAQVSGRSAPAAAADLGLKRLLGRVVDVPDEPGAAYVAGLDGRHKLGITALTGLALYEQPLGEHHHPVRDRLLAGVYDRQTDSGLFLTAFPPVRRMSSQYYFPGEALLLIARAYEDQPSRQALEAFNKGFAYYRELWRTDPTPPFAAWHMQAFARMALVTKRRDFADFAFEMADWLADKQYDESNCPWPELHGGIEAYVDARVGVATASYLEGLTEALSLARRLEDDLRRARYERTVRLAA